MVTSDRGAKITLVIFTMATAMILHLAMGSERSVPVGVSSETTASIPEEP
jgi:hypothetical protein